MKVQDILLLAAVALVAKKLLQPVGVAKLGDITVVAPQQFAPRVNGNSGFLLLDTWGMF